MKNFKFNLESVLHLRERDRDHAAEQLQKAELAKQQLLTQIDDLLADRDSQNSYRAAPSGHLNPQRMLEAQRYQIQLDSQVDVLREKVSLVDQECERRRARLLKCEQAVRSMEKLREKKASEHNSVEASKAQDALDQWASFRYWSNNQTAKK